MDIPQWRVQEFVGGGGGGGGGKYLKGFFLLFNFSRGAQLKKIAEKMIFPTTKVAKYR